MTAVNNVYLKRIPAGIPGAVSREWEHTGEPNQLDGASPPTLFGDFVKMGANGRIQALAVGDAAAAIYGLLERAFPGGPGTYTGASGGYGLGPATPQPGGRCTILKRGYISVVVQGATVPLANGPVFVRIAGAPPAGGRLNGVEAAADATAGNTIQVPNCYFRGAADANGNTEIAYNL